MAGQIFSDALFSDLDFSQVQLVNDSRSQTKLNSRFKKNNYKFRGKIAADIEEIKRDVMEVNEGESLELLSASIDSPNVINAYAGQINELYVATWAITPAGLQSLANAAEQGCGKIVILMDRTHSYKWIFKDGAYELLKGKVIFKFMANHAKFICMKLQDNTVINFVGSMNLSNNPRIENMRITKDRDEFNFFKNFINNTEGLLI